MNIEDFLQNKDDEKDILNSAISRSKEIHKKVKEEMFEEEDIDSILEYNGPQSPGEHEAVDRAVVTIEYVQNFLLNHPAIVLNDKAFGFAFVCMTYLVALYEHLTESHNSEESDV